MHNIVPTCLCSLVLWSVPLGTTAAQEVHRLELDEALRLFADHNLELRMARALTVGREGAARQATAFPNPVAFVTHENLGNKGLKYTETYFAVHQEIDWPWKHSAMRASATSTGLALAATFARDSALLALEVQRTYVDVDANEARLESLAEVRDIFRQAERSATARLQEGDISGYDVRRLRVELARYEILYATEDLNVRRLRRRLATLVLGESNAAQMAPNDRMGPPPQVATQTLLPQAMRRRPELTAATERLAAADESARAARSSRIPNLTLTGGYKTQNDGFNGLFFGAAWPVPIFNGRGQGVIAGEARVTAAQEDLLLTRQVVRADVADATDAYETIMKAASLVAGDLLNGHRDLLPIARTSYSEGAMTLLEVLDAARAYWDAVSYVIDIRARAWVAYFELERAIGGFADGSEEAP